MTTATRGCGHVSGPTRKKKLYFTVRRRASVLSYYDVDLTRK
jgi:hypothetical protein